MCQTWKQVFVVAAMATILGHSAECNAQRKPQLLQPRAQYLELDNIVDDDSRSDFERAEAALKSGTTRVRQASNATADDVQAAIRLFERAVDLGKAGQRAQASNNLGSLYLRSGDADRALAAFAKCTVEDVEPAHRFVWYFNMGRAYGLKEDASKAIDYYLKSLKENPQFTSAADQAWALALNSSQPRQHLNEIGEAMIVGKQAASLLEKCYESLKSTDGPIRDEVLSVAVRALANLPITPAIFVEREEPKLRAAEVPSQAMEEVRLAYQGTLEVEASSIRGERLSQFSWWSAEPQRKVAMSELLNQVGDFYSSRGMFPSKEVRDLRVAYPRYLLAWMINVENWTAAESAAWVLTALPANQDSLKGDGASVLIDRQERLIEALFDAKAPLFMKREKTPEEWEHLLRLHLLLGMLFEAKEQWGSERQARSAIFQWTRALKIEQRIASMEGKDQYSAVGLHTRLATAYRAIDDKSNAFHHYLVAAETYRRRNELEKAKEYALLAKNLSFSRSSTQNKRLARILRLVRIAGG